MRVILDQVQVTLNNIGSLFGLIPNRIQGSSTFPMESLCQLAARHHGLPNGEFIFRPGKCLKLSKNKIKYPPLVVYEETRDGNLNDIWLGHLRFTGYFTISANINHILQTTSLEATNLEETSSEPINLEAINLEAINLEKTIFIIPYERKDGEYITKTLFDNYRLLSPLDIQSIGYCSTSTGSSRLLRTMSEIIKRSLDDSRLSILLLMDLLNASSIIRYKYDCESEIFDYISKLLNMNRDSDIPITYSYSESRLLDKIATLFSLRKLYNEVTSIMIKTFSDFICDRLEFLSPRAITNIVSAVGNSKCLDEFWMFMMAKRIQDTAKLYEPEDLATIIDTYATASLEDTGFYESVCENVKDKLDQFTPHQLAVILSALARVRIRDSDLMHGAIEIIKHYLLQEYHSEIFTQSLKTLHKRDLSQDILVIAYTLVASSELDYRDDTLDLLWRILALRLKDTVFDISVSTWLPFAIATYPSPISLRIFLPIWVNHVNTISRRIKSKTFGKTIQRRHALLLQCFNTGIIPKDYILYDDYIILNEICKNTKFTRLFHEDCSSNFTPESSTFHLEVSACLRGLQVQHQRELQSIPFVLDIVIHQQTLIKDTCINTRQHNEIWEGYNLHHDRYSPNHRKHKRETYIYKPLE